MMHWLRRVAMAAGAAALLGLPFQAAPDKPARVLFEEIPPDRSGIGWVHENAMSPERYLPESLPPGAAFLDFDNDGLLDLFLVNTGPSDFYQPKRPLAHALYRNNGDGTFADVAQKAGVAGGRSFGMGAAAADYDNDGHTDLLVTAYGPPTLYRNNGDGTFADVTGRAGVTGPAWSTSAVWFDYDNDGDLDLFLCNFVQYGPDQRFACGDNKLGRKYYCIPRVFKPTSSVLYRNNGDGTFTEVSQGTGIEKAQGKALGVVATDINNDGWMDLFVANDTVQNFLFVNRGGGKWEEAGMAAEVAFSADGRARSGMGVDAADFNQDGLADLFVANVDQEMFSLYENQGDESFRDAAHAHGVAQATRLLSGWGLKFFDYDNDGEVDLFLANGHPDDMIENYSLQVKYAEPLLLFHNEGGRMRDVSKSAGPAFGRYYPARGLAVGDYDNDGAIDVLVANNGQAPLLLRNRAAEGANWIGLRLVGTTANRDAIGARIRWSVNGRERWWLKTGGGSYLSSHDPREVLGLGAAAKPDWVEIAWPRPSGKVERFTDLPGNRYVTIVEGEGVHQ
jgi:enediyne biosynthesis protein E4